MLSCDQEPEDLIAIFVQQLAEGGEFLPNKKLEAYRKALERLSLEINDSHHLWSQESFRQYWMELKADKFTLLVLDHLSSIQGQFFWFNFLGLFWGFEGFSIFLILYCKISFLESVWSRWICGELKLARSEGVGSILLCQKR